LAEAYSLYDTCRTRQMVIHDFNKPGGKIEVRVVFIPVGYSFLPYSGGWLDQPAYICDSFEQFFAGELLASVKRLTK
jgi:hypothetical protein